MNRTLSLHHLSIFFLGVIFLAGCRKATTPPTLPSPTYSFPTSWIPTPTPTGPYPILEEITPENIDHMKIIGELGNGRIHDFALSPDDRTLAVYTASTIYLYDSWAMDERGSIDAYSSETGAVTFSPSGDLLAFSTQSDVFVWNLSTQQPAYWFMSDIPALMISDIEFSPEGNQILVTTTGGYSSCGGMGVNYALYDLQGHLLFDRYFCSDHAESYYHFQDGKIYVIFSSLMTSVFPLEVYVVDLRSGGLLASSIKTLEEYPDGFSEVTTGSMEFLPSEEEVLAWKPTNDQEKTSQTFECDIIATQHTVDRYTEVYTNGSKVLFSVSRFQQIVSLELWDIPSCTLKKKIAYPSADKVIFNPDGALLAASNGYDAYVWETTEPKVRFAIHGTPFKNPVDILAFNTDGTRLLTSTFGRDYIHPSQPYREYLISVWDTLKGKKLLEIKPNGEFLKQIVSAPDRTIIMAEDSMGLNFWNIETGELLTTLPSGAFEFDVFDKGIWVAVKQHENLQTITLFDYRTGEIRQELGSIEAWVRDLSINAEGDEMAVWTFRGQREGDEMIVFDLETKTRIWNVETELEWQYNAVWTFKQEEPFLAFPGSVREKSIETIITQDDKLFQFWDAQNGNYLGDVYSVYEMNGIAANPTGHQIATVGKSGVIYIWGIKRP